MADEKRLGPASLALPFNGAALAGGHLVVSTRNISPASLAVVDPRSWEIEATVDIPTGTGAWGMATVGDAVYLGQQQGEAGPNLFRYDLTDGRLTGVARLDTTVVWDLAAGLDGTIYGVARDLAPFAFDPATGRARLLGGVPLDVDILRSVAFVAGLVIVGGRRAGSPLLLAVNPETGRARSLLPDRLAGDTLVYTLAAGRGREVVAGTEGPGGERPAVARIPLDDARGATVVRLDGEALVDALAVDGPRVYATARRSGSVWVAEGGRARRLAAPVPHAEHRGLFLHAGTLLGVSAAERVFRLDPADGEAEVVDLIARGIRPRPERAQSMAARDGTVWVGGNFSLQRLDATGGRERLFVPGEPKDLLIEDDSVWLALYPGGEVWRRDDGAAPRRHATLPAEHNRPVTMAWDGRSGRLVVTAASDHLGGGSLTLVDPGSGAATSTLRAVFGDVRRPPAGLAVHDGVAYVGGYRADPPIAAIALDGWRRLWETPVAGVQTMIGLAVVDERVYGFTPDGWFVVLAADDGRILHRARLPHPGGRLVAQGGWLYGAGRDALVRFDPRTYESRVIRDGLDAVYWNHAFLAADGDRLYVLAGHDILAVRDTA